MGNLFPLKEFFSCRKSVAFYLFRGLVDAFGIFLKTAKPHLRKLKPTKGFVVSLKGNISFTNI